MIDIYVYYMFQASIALHSFKNSQNKAADERGCGRLDWAKEEQHQQKH
jgi:hypothetical protein